MKTTLNERPTLAQLNLKSDPGVFSHRILRTKLIAELHYNPKKHDKGLMYKEDGHLFIAYTDLNKKPCYVPMISYPNRNEKN